MKVRDVNKGLPLIDVCSVEEYALKLLLLDCHSKTWHVFRQRVWRALHVKGHWLC